MKPECTDAGRGGGVTGGCGQIPVGRATPGLECGRTSGGARYLSLSLSLSLSVFLSLEAYRWRVRMKPEYANASREGRVARARVSGRQYGGARERDANCVVPTRHLLPLSSVRVHRRNPHGPGVFAAAIRPAVGNRVGISEI